ncbi:procathepsin L-like [Mya arenaria]|uniref:procathepsin L-like n=1 Tax=Mya arenaria TaxID=6604 RepID=UPI0022E148F8|nr:procathepsin L-like [Mya arenaria]
MFRLLIAVCMVASIYAFDSKLDSEWEAYKLTYKKSYGKNEDYFRRQIWESNIAYIQRHNLEADRGVHTYTLGMNKYGDMNNDEFVAQMTGLNMTRSTNAEGCTKYTPYSGVKTSDLPDTVDWRTEGYVTGVKDQGACGSCWAFCAAGALEGQHFKKTGELVSLSEKNLMDCSWSYGNMGCLGGWPNSAFEYIIDNGGVNTEESYPYEPKDGDCMFDPANIGATMTGCQDIAQGSEDQLQVAAANIGPISVGMDAGHLSFQLYKSGIYHDAICANSIDLLNHGVVLIGYGNEKSGEYWLVKNSWGKSWGMEGYGMMSRNRNNNCGIATAASFPTV